MNSFLYGGGQSSTRLKLDDSAPLDSPPTVAH